LFINKNVERQALEEERGTIQVFPQVMIGKIQKTKDLKSTKKDN